MIDYIDIFITFIKIGAVNFGGGYSMLPLLQEELVNRKQWTTDQELLDYFSIGQCTPGIIAINVSTFIGYKKKGILGALCSTLGFVTIPLFIIILIATFLTNFSHIPLVRHAFAGIRVCVFVLIIQAIQRLWKKSIVNKQTLLIFLVGGTVITDSPGIKLFLPGTSITSTIVSVPIIFIMVSVCVIVGIESLPTTPGLLQVPVT